MLQNEFLSSPPKNTTDSQGPKPYLDVPLEARKWLIGSNLSVVINRIYWGDSPLILAFY